MNPFERVQKLVALASNAGAPIDEQRNAALAAVKLIVEHKMLDERAVPPPPPLGGFGGLGSIFAGLTADVVMKSVSEIAVGAGAMEIMELRNKKLVLERRVAGLEREIERLHAELVGKADAPKPHRMRRKRR